MDMAKPKIRFKGYQEDWEQRKLGEVVDVYDGVHQTPDYKENGVMFLSVENISTLQSNKYISEEAFERDYKVYPEKGDILMTRIGDIGTTNVVESTEKVAFYVSLALLKTKITNPYFLSNAMKNEAFQKGLRQRSLLTAIPQKINKDEIGKTDIFLTVNLEEQEKIGDYFRNLDHLITLHQRKCDETKKLKKYMLQKMFPQNGKKVPELRFSEFTDDWEQRKLEDYLEVSREKNREELLGKEDVLSVSGEFGIVNQIEFQGRSFAGASVANYGVVETGDVVYTKSPLKSNPYGIIKTNKGKIGIVSTLYAVYKPKKNVDSEFVQIYFESDSRMNSYMHPLVNKGAKNDMKVSDANALKGPVVFPKIEEQTVISQYFDSLDNLITLHQRKYEELQKVKKFMLQNMFV